jgi:hypothetical protein
MNQVKGQFSPTHRECIQKFEPSTGVMGSARNYGAGEVRLNPHEHHCRLESPFKLSVDSSENNAFRNFEVCQTQADTPKRNGERSGMRKQTE